MNAERWEHVKELFVLATDERSSCRGTALLEACGRDADLFHEVATLLDHHDRSDSFLETPTHGSGSLSGQIESWHVPSDRRIGPYQMSSARAEWESSIGPNKPGRAEPSPSR
jgi:hypothetical protein